MSRQIKQLLSLIVACSFLATFALPTHAQHDWSFTTLPMTGEIVGQPGETIGWGYVITNDSPSQWLWVAYLSASNPFVNGLNSSVFDQPVIAPNSSVTIPYDQGQGLMDLTWELTAPVGFFNQGVFEVEAGWFDGDPFDPNSTGNYIQDAGVRSSPYKATVVPEPSSFWTTLMVFGTATLSALKKLVPKGK